MNQHKALPALFLDPGQFKAMGFRRKRPVYWANGGYRSDASKHTPAPARALVGALLAARRKGRCRPKADMLAKAAYSFIGGM